MEDKIFTMDPEREQPLHHRWADMSVIFFIIRKIEFSCIYKNKYFLYAHRDLSVYMARIWKSIFRYNSKVSLRGLKVYRWAESSAKIFKTKFLLKGNFNLMEMNGRKNFYDGSRARATLAPSLSGLECYFFL